MCTITTVDCASCTKSVDTISHCRSFLPHEVCKDIKHKLKMSITCKECRELLEGDAEIDGDGWDCVGGSDWSHKKENHISRR